MQPYELLWLHSETNPIPVCSTLCIPDSTDVLVYHLDVECLMQHETLIFPSLHLCDTLLQAQVYSRGQLWIDLLHEHGMVITASAKLNLSFIDVTTYRTLRGSGIEKRGYNAMCMTFRWYPHPR